MNLEQATDAINMGPPLTAAPVSRRALRKQQHKVDKKRQKLADRVTKHDELLVSGRLLRQSAEKLHALPSAASYRDLPEFTDADLVSANLGKIPAASPSTPEFQPDDSTSCTSTTTRLHPSPQTIVSRFLFRPPAYTDKYAGQELSLLFQVWRIVQSDEEVDAIIDVGAGNANLSLLIALVCRLPVVCVEMESPRRELQAESVVRAQLAQRGIDMKTGTDLRVSRVADQKIEEWSMPPEYKRVVLLGKHLCGPGTDAAIAFIARERQRVAGCVFATCCFNKISGETHRAFYPDMMPLCFPAPTQENENEKRSVPASSTTCRDEDDEQELSSLASAEAVATNIVVSSFPSPSSSSPTSSSTKSAAEVLSPLPASPDEVVDQLARKTAWRNTSRAETSLITEEMLVEAEYFESWLQEFRVRRLREIFAFATQFIYCHSGPHSQQNRCLVGAHAALPKENEATAKFFELVHRRAEEQRDWLPIDLRPRGLVSIKFNYDGMDLVDVPLDSALAPGVARAKKTRRVEEEGGTTGALSSTITAIEEGDEDAGPSDHALLFPTPPKIVRPVIQLNGKAKPVTCTMCGKRRSIYAHEAEKFEAGGKWSTSQFVCALLKDGNCEQAEGEEAHTFGYMARAALDHQAAKRRKELKVLEKAAKQASSCESSVVPTVLQERAQAKGSVLDAEGDTEMTEG